MVSLRSLCLNFCKDLSEAPLLDTAHRSLQAKPKHGERTFEDPTLRDLCLHWRADGDVGQSEKGNMGTVFTSRGKAEQVSGYTVQGIS